MNSTTTLVLGATGKTGRRIAARMTQAGYPVRLGSRSAPIPFDWEKRDTWTAALDGVSSAYVSYQPDLAVPGALTTLSAFFDAAVACGVGKLVLLSGRGEPEAQDAEQLLQSTRVDWTILRASWFCQNFSESFFLEPITAGEVALPAKLAAEPFVDVEDIAEIAVAALTSADHSRKLYELTGPQAITFPQAFAEIAAAANRSIVYTPVSMDDYRAELVRQNIPSDYVELVMYLFGTVLDGRNTPLADGVQQALGRAPRSFADYVRRTAATGIWDAEQSRPA